MRQFTIPREIPGTMPYSDFAKFPSIGPFLTKTYLNGESAEYTRNPSYWNQPLPYVDSAKIKFYGDQASALAALQTGEADFYEIRGKQLYAPIIASRPRWCLPLPVQGARCFVHQWATDP